MTKTSSKTAKRPGFSHVKPYRTKFAKPSGPINRPHREPKCGRLPITATKVELMAAHREKMARKYA